MRLLLAASILVLAGLPRAADAHEGPPYLVLLDTPVGPYEVTLWADPDVGMGTFFVSFGAAAREGEPVSVQLEVWPRSGRLAPATTTAVSRGDGSFVASVAFDRAESWTVRVRAAGGRGAGHTQLTVDVTPPGYGRWDLLIYAAPFVAVSLLWARAALRGPRNPAGKTRVRHAAWKQ